MFSIKRRIVTIVLCSELALTGAATGVALLYQRAQLRKSLDVMVQGRADSVMAAVVEVSDDSDEVRLDQDALHLPQEDIYLVREGNGRLLGRSPNWKSLASSFLASDRGWRNFRSGRERFRGLATEGVRTVDPDEHGAGEAHTIRIYYAAPTRSFHAALEREARVLALVNLLVLALTGVVVLWLLQKGLAPLDDLALAAAAVSPATWTFRPPATSREIAELRPLIETLERALSRLELAFTHQSIFLHDAAHELKTALTIFKSSLQLLTLRQRSAEEYRSGLELCLADCGRMEELIGKLLLLARLEQSGRPEDSSAGTQPRNGSAAGGGESATEQSPRRDPAEAAANLISCVHGCVGQLAPSAELAGVELKVESEDAQAGRDGLWVALFPDDCATLVTNLVHNAIQHSQAGAAVLVEVRRRRDDVVLAVNDQGSGILPADLPFVFERFFRGDRSRSRRSGGTGLGLAICRAIVQANGGALSIASEPGKGTRVTAELRLAAAPAPLPR